MFCPNCGTQNDSAATPCKKCGFKLSHVSVPKFKGTMMLNSDQTVQEAIEQQRRRQALVGGAEKKPSGAAPGSVASPKKISSAPPSSLGSPKGPVLQPPRAAPRGRMGGTMLGVAPQAGGITPPAGPRPKQTDAAAPASRLPDEPAATEAPPLSPRAEAMNASPEPAPSSDPADPLAGTVASPRMPAAPPLDDERDLSGTAAAELAGPAPAPSRTATVTTPPPEAEMTPEPPAAATAAATASKEAAGKAAAEADLQELRAAETQPPRNRAIAPTAPLPQQPDLVAARVAPSSLAPRVRALDVVLIVCTLGLYGIVLLFRQRKRPA